MTRGTKAKPASRSTLVGKKRITLEPNERDKFAFAALRDKLGISKDAEVIRQAITKLAELNGIELPKSA